MKKLIIIDGNSLLFRAFYATYNPNTPIMRNKEGIPTNALFAFSNMMNKIVNDFKSDEHLLVVFDTGKKTFRHTELESYKANRKPLPPDLIPQLGLARDYLLAMGIYTYELDGFEGDDIAGSAAKIGQLQGFDVSIYTSDRDFLQLIDENIRIHIIKRGLSDIVIMDKKALFDEYELTPEQIPDYKGLMGDSSDNLQGIPGVGDKTAVKLIKQFGDLESIIKASYDIKGKVYENIVNHQESGRLCKHLAEIKTDMVLPFSLNDTIYLGYDFQRLSSFCARYELKQLMNKLNYRKASNAMKKNEIVFETIENIEHIKLENKIGLALDMEKGNYHEAPVYGLAFTNGLKTYYLTWENALKDHFLKALLENEAIGKYCYDFKAIKVALSRFGINIKGLQFDLLIASYVLDSSLENNVDAVFNFFGIELSKISEKVDLFDLGNPQNSLRTAEVACNALALYDSVVILLKKSESLNLYNEIELPLISVLAEMEIEGFPLNKEKLNEIGQQFRDKIDIISAEIYGLADEKFNIASPKKVGEILFEKLKIKNINKKISTSVDVLKKIIDEHPIVAKILEHRKYAKLISTYVDGLISYIHADGLLHPMFNQALTTTGRLSSSEPNIQNISIRDEEGRLIRKAFYYDNNDLVVLSLDYSQIELRVLASLSKCEKLIEAFNNDDDIHALTAKHVFHKEIVTNAERRQAKTVNFGIVYGISDWGLAEQLDINPFEARMIIKEFYTAYPEILTFMRSIAEKAEKDGYVKTMLGRIRYIREFHDSNYQVREFAKRAAINAPIQGTAADIIKIAMIRIAKMLKEKQFKTQMVLQIHDELIFKVPKAEIDFVEPLIRELMESALKLECKLKVDGSYGESWYNAK